jgi:hypothetical protein
MQSGMLASRSSARDLWVGGVGPIQDGSIHKGTLIGGQAVPDLLTGGAEEQVKPAGSVSILQAAHWGDGAAKEGPGPQQAPSGIVPVSGKGH